MKTFSTANLRRLLKLRAPGKTFEITDYGQSAVVSCQGANAVITMTNSVTAAFEVDTYLSRIG